MKRYLIITSRQLLAGLAAATVLTVVTAGFVQNAIPAMAQEGRRLPVYGVQRDDKAIALTFNAAWEPDDIPQLLALLSKEQVRCTFFLVGQWAQKNPEQAKMIAQEQHEIANHSYAHPDMTKLSAQRIREDIQQADDAIRQATGGVFPVLFRAPSGAYNNTVVQTAQELSHTVIQWSVDSRDWQKPDAQTIVDRVLKKAQPGAIVLMHTGLDNTHTALPDLILKLKAQGYRFVTVSDLLLQGETRIDHNGIQHPAA